MIDQVVALDDPALQAALRGQIAYVAIHDPLPRTVQTLSSVVAKGSRFLVGPPQFVELTPQGMPIGRSAYSDETRAAIDRLTLNGDAVINPRFTVTGAHPERVVPQAASHALYIVVPAKSQAWVCTSLNADVARLRSWCLRVTDKERVTALERLFVADFSIMDATSAATQKRAAQVAGQHLVVSPEAPNELMTALRQPTATVITSEPPTQPYLQALAQNRATLVLPADYKASQLTRQAISSGVAVRFTDSPIAGTIVLGPQRIYLGSHRLKGELQPFVRDVGLSVPATAVPTAELQKLQRLAGQSPSTAP